MPASISIAIRNSIIREGLRRIFTDACFEVADSVSELDELDLSFHSANDQHLLVIERDLLQDDYTDVLERLQGDYPNLRVVVLVSTFDFDEMVALYAAGAYAYFPDNVPYLSLVAILQMVSNGQKVAPPEVIDFLINLPAASRRSGQSPALESYNFRDRELRVLEQLALGQPNKAISREMGINEAAVKAAVKAILRKLGVENRTQAAVLARELVSQHANADASEGRTGDHGASSSSARTAARSEGGSSRPTGSLQFAGNAQPALVRPVALQNNRNKLLQSVIQKTTICLCYVQALQMVCLS